MIDHLIRSKIKEGGAELDDRTELGKHICKRMPLHNQARLESLYKTWVVYWRLPQANGAQQQETQRQFKLRIRRRKNRLKTGVDGTVPPPQASASATVAPHDSPEEETTGESRSEVWRHRLADAGSAMAAAAGVGIVVLKGSLWQPLVSKTPFNGNALDVRAGRICGECSCDCFVGGVGYGFLDWETCRYAELFSFAQATAETGGR